MNIILSTVLAGIFMMFSGFFIKRPNIQSYISIGFIILIIIASIAQLKGYEIMPGYFTNMIYNSVYGISFFILLSIATLYYFVLNIDNFKQVNALATNDFFALIFFSLTGISILSQFNNLLMMFIGIELLSIPMYVLAGSAKNNMKSTEAAMKYFLMGSFSTGILLMGITLIYGGTGSFMIEEIGNINLQGFDNIYFMGWLLLIIAFCFKISVAPFHFWAPDVYDGSPTIFTSYMSTIVKGGAFLGFVQILWEFPWTHDLSVNYRLVIAFIILLTLFIGNFSALYQSNVKRMLAYSSIVQAGFMMFITLQRTDLSRDALLFYVFTYSIAGITLFYALTIMKGNKYKDFNGLGKTNPFLAGILSISLISLAGIPLTSGFFAKFFVLSNAVNNPQNISLVIAALVMAVLSIYYYFKVIVAMYFKNGIPEIEPIPAYSKLTLFVGAAIIIILGLFPNLLSNIFYSLLS